MGQPLAGGWDKPLTQKTGHLARFLDLELPTTAHTHICTYTPHTHKDINGHPCSDMTSMPGLQAEKQHLHDKKTDYWDSNQFLWGFCFVLFSEAGSQSVQARPLTLDIAEKVPES